MAIDIARERGVLDFDKLTGKVKKKQKNGVDAEAVIRFFWKFLKIFLKFLKKFLDQKFNQKIKKKFFSVQ